MSLVSHTNYVTQSIAADRDRVPLVLLALTLLVFLIARPSMDLSAPAFQGVDIGDLGCNEALPGHYAPYIPNTLRVDEKGNEVFEADDGYYYNLKANSFGSLRQSTEISRAKLQRMFSVLPLSAADREVFVNVLMEESDRSKVHGCFVASLLLTPGVHEEATAHSLSSPVNHSGEMVSRLAMVGTLNGEGVTPVAAHAIVATRYTALLMEAFEGRANLVSLAYWKGFAELNALSESGAPLAVEDLDMLHTAVKIFAECSAS